VPFPFSFKSLFGGSAASSTGGSVGGGLAVKAAAVAATGVVVSGVGYQGLRHTNGGADGEKAHAAALATRAAVPRTVAAGAPRPLAARPALERSRTSVAGRARRHRDEEAGETAHHAVPRAAPPSEHEPATRRSRDDEPATETTPKPVEQQATETDDEQEASPPEQADTESNADKRWHRDAGKASDDARAKTNPKGHGKRKGKGSGKRNGMAEADPSPAHGTTTVEARSPPHGKSKAAEDERVEAPDPGDPGERDPEPPRGDEPHAAPWNR
jgi:hypothetical protein